MTQKTSQYLYHFPYSETIGGFYQSEVFVVAESLNQAKNKVKQIIKTWLQDKHRGGISHNTASYSYMSTFEKEEVLSNLENKMNQLEEELHKVYKINSFGIIRYHS